MWDKIKFLFIAGLFLLGAPWWATAETNQSVFFSIPDHCQLKIGGVVFKAETKNGKFGIPLPNNLNYPLGLEVRGPLGGIYRQQVQNKTELAALRVESGLIKDSDPNPETVSMLPSLCSRLRPAVSKSAPAYIYSGQKDPLNHIPSLQLSEPDAWEGEAIKAYQEMDGKNVLMVKRAKITYDYEDNAIVDYTGPNPSSGENQVVHEGTGGFYANFHVAVFPYADGLKNLDRQSLLHLAQGHLKEIGKAEIRPVLRTHSFLPGPFQSKGHTLYQMCEWGDTAHQAPIQELSYENLALWDWDYSVPGADHLLLVVFESDEEENFLREKKIPDHYMTDDIVGVFEVKRGETLKELVLKNERGDFEISIQSGDMAVPPRPMIERAFFGSLR